MLRVVQSNQLERLALRLSHSLGMQQLDQDWQARLRVNSIVVPSHGTAQWLKIRIAEHLGIAANLRFQLPGEFAWSIAQQLFHELPDESAFHKDALTLLLTRLMPDALSRATTAPADANFAALHAYLADGRDTQKRYQLARRVADVFDQYLVYRPDWIAQMESDPAAASLGTFRDAPWQVGLWQLAREAVRVEMHGADVDRDRSAGPRGGADADVDAAGDDRLRAEAWTGMHRAEVTQRVLARLQHASVPQLAGSAPLWAFGFSALPPDQLQLLAALATHVDVTLFTYNPCREYWGDVVADKQRARIAVRSGGAEQYFESGNPLLSSMASLARDFIDLTQQAVDQLGAAAEIIDDFVTPEAATLLGQVQRDVLGLTIGGSRQDRLAEPAAAIAKWQPPNGEPDRSITVHGCHSALREIEVLHDQLLACFEQDPTLLPKDVVVMIPDLERYAPCIEAVFGSAPEERFIPFVVSDRSELNESGAVSTFFALLALASSRWTVSEVFDVLEAPLVAGRFGLGSTGMQVLRRWLKDANVHWGLDGDHWQRWLDGMHAADVPEDATKQSAPDASGAAGPSESSASGAAATDAAATDAAATDAAASNAAPSNSDANNNTWSFGIDRLLMGYALGDADRAFAGVLPLAGVNSAVVDELDALLRFFSGLKRWQQRAQRPRPAAEWSALLTRLLDEFFAAAHDDEDARAVSALYQAFARLQRHSSQTGLTETLSLATVRDYLRDQLQGIVQTPGFLTGQLTFCTLLPLRALPFRRVCLVGMNEGDYPRYVQPFGFDLMAKQPRKGDRSRRMEDRLLFLQALLSAEQALYISYQSRSDRDDAPRVPSVLVAELLDYLDAAMQVDGRPVREHVFVQHPLQPFDRRYFTDTEAASPAGPSALFSYDRRWLSDARTGTIPGSHVALKPLPAHRNDVPPLIEVRDLREFVRAPYRWYLRDVLQTRFAEAEDDLADEEPYALDGLSSWQLRDQALRDAERADLYEWAPLTGALPHGAMGASELRTLTEQVQMFRAVAAPWLSLAASEHMVRLQVSVDGNAIDIAGAVPNVTQQGWVRVRTGTARARDLVEFWLMHLLVNADGSALPSHLVDEANVHMLPPLAAAEAERYLTALVGGFIVHRRRPWPLLVDTAMAWLQGDEQKANKAWVGSESDDGRGQQGERDNAYARFTHGDGALPPRGFMGAAEQVYGALVKLLATEKHSSAKTVRSRG